MCVLNRAVRRRASVGWKHYKIKRVHKDFKVLMGSVSEMEVVRTTINVCMFMFWTGAPEVLTLAKRLGQKGSTVTPAALMRALSLSS